MERKGGFSHKSESFTSFVRQAHSSLRDQGEGVEGMCVIKYRLSRSAHIHWSWWGEETRRLGVININLWRLTGIATCEETSWIEGISSPWLLWSLKKKHTKCYETGISIKGKTDPLWWDNLFGEKTGTLYLVSKNWNDAKLCVTLETIFSPANSCGSIGKRKVLQKTLKWKTKHDRKEAEGIFFK